MSITEQDEHNKSKAMESFRRWLEKRGPVLHKRALHSQRRGNLFVGYISLPNRFMSGATEAWGIHRDWIVNEATAFFNERYGIASQVNAYHTPAHFTPRLSLRLAATK
jgi:hypothetical protein